MTDHTAGAEAARALLPDSPHHQPERPTLPAATDHRFSLDDVQLHDLCYHAATRYLRTQHGMTLARAHDHAGRIAAMAVVAAWAEHGPDPSAGAS